jgi:hypothetical protein
MCCISLFIWYADLYEQASGGARMDTEMIENLENADAEEESSVDAMQAEEREHCILLQYCGYLSSLLHNFIAFGVLDWLLVYGAHQCSSSSSSARRRDHGRARHVYGGTPPSLLSMSRLSL